jgi:hypothetical protein
MHAAALWGIRTVGLRLAGRMQHTRQPLLCTVQAVRPLRCPVQSVLRHNALMALTRSSTAVPGYC